MPRLIDADELIHVMQCQCMRTMEQGCNPRYTKGMKYAIELVKRAETVDNIVHARWLPVTGDFWKCSECHCETQDGGDFCEHCGAKMDADELRLE